jgi:hypothetical protein
MLTRVGPDTFSAPADSSSTIVAQSDDGAPSATFSYGTALPTQTIQGLPGCTFDVDSGLKMFRCVVVFGQGPAPRYDLFEVDANGLLVDLNLPLTPTTTGTMRQVRIRGVEVPAVAATPRTRRAKSAKRARPKKAKRATKATSATKAKRTKKAGRKTAKGRRHRRRGGAGR